jgi:hypothetical protein
LIFPLARRVFFAIGSELSCTRPRRRGETTRTAHHGPGGAFDAAAKEFVTVRIQVNESTFPESLAEISPNVWAVNLDAAIACPSASAKEATPPNPWPSGTRADRLWRRGPATGLPKEPT